MATVALIVPMAIIAASLRMRGWGRDPGRDDTKAKRENGQKAERASGRG